MNFTKSTFLLIIALVLTPFIIFLGKNSLQTEFFTIQYFLFTFFYCLLFLFACISLFLVSKKTLIFSLFIAYFNFIQFYFFDLRKILFLVEGNYGYYILILIVLISLIAVFFSRFIVFRNFILILLFLNIGVSMFNLIPSISKFLKPGLQNTTKFDQLSGITTSGNIKYPNIFYIIPDGLSSPQVLKNYADIDYKDSINKFEEKNFFVSKHIYSSYNLTYLSLAALFLMDYPITNKSEIYEDRSNFYPSLREYDPEILRYLKKNNYQFVIIPPAWGGCPKSKEYRCLKPFTDTFFSNFFQDYAVSKMFQHSLIKTFFDRYNNKYNITRSDMNDAGKTALDHMKVNSEHWIDGGVFTMIHMMIPHAPYRDKDCNIIDGYANQPKEGYKLSVYCAFKRIHELSDFIIKNYPNASIIVQADHGIYLNKDDVNKGYQELSESFVDSRMGIFTAVRGCNSDVASKLNQANIVKNIVQCLVRGNTDENLLNKSFFGFYEKNPEFGKVYRVRKK